MMKTVSILLLLLTMIIFSSGVAVGDTTPMLCWGTVQIDSVNAPSGTLVEIFVGDDSYPSGIFSVEYPGTYGAVVVRADDSKYGELLSFKIDGLSANKLGPDNGVFSLENQVVNIAVLAAPSEKIWEFWGPGYVPRHLPDSFYGEVLLTDIENVPPEVQGVYKFDDTLGEWLFWGPGAPGTTLDRLVGGTFADYTVTVTGECKWIIVLGGN